MKSNIINKLTSLCSNLEYLGKQKELRWTKKITGELLKTERISPQILQIFGNLINCSLERKLAYIREQERVDEERSMNAQYEAELASRGGRIESGNLDPQQTLDTSEGDTEMPRSKYTPREIDTDLDSEKGFAGTSLRLFPNVRETKIDLGEESP
jgi:hypothetical protein